MNNNIESKKKKSFIVKNIKLLFKDLLNHLENKEFLKQYVTKETSFIRKRKLSLSNISKLLFAKSFLSLTAFLCLQFKKNQKASVTKQAFSKARKNISPLLFQDLNTYLVHNVYQDFSLKRWNNKYFLFSIDGTTLELPNTQSLREEFGHTKSQVGSKENARASATCIYDSLNEIIISSTIENYNTSEREMALQLLEQLKENEQIQKETILYLMDRGYYSNDMLVYFLLNQEKFLFRLRGNVLTKYFEEMESEEEWITISLNQLYKNGKKEEFKEKIKEKKISVRLRFTKVILDTGEEEHLLSNVEDIPYEQMKELYFKRWKIKENYKFLKTKVAIENFSSKTRRSILQDFYATVLNANIQYLINQCARKKQSKKGREYQTNKNLLASLYKESISSNILMEKSKLCSFMNSIVNYLSMYQFIKPLENRTFKRSKDERVKANKFSINLRPI